MAEVPADGTGEDQALEVAAFLDEAGELVVLRDADDVLLNDGAFVEYFSDVVTGSSYEFDASGEGGMVGAGSGEGGEERVVNVDDALWVGLDERWREYLHVTGKDDEIGRGRSEEFELLGLDSSLGRGGDWQIVERDLMKVRQGLGTGVITDDGGDVAEKLAGLMTVE